MIIMMLIVPRNARCVMVFTQTAAPMHGPPSCSLVGGLLWVLAVSVTKPSPLARAGQQLPSVSVVCRNQTWQCHGMIIHNRRKVAPPGGDLQRPHDLGAVTSVTSSPLGNAGMSTRKRHAGHRLGNRLWHGQL